MANLSYICTPSTDPYIYESVPDRLRLLVEDDPERTAFVFYSLEGIRVSVTRKELYEKSLSLAKTLYQLGVRKGSPVAICLNNSINTLYAIFGVTLAGGVLFSIATNLKDGSDVIERLTDMVAEYFIIDASAGDVNWVILDAIWSPSAVSSDQVPSLKSVICNGKEFVDTKGRLHLNELLSREVPEDIELPAVYPEDTLVCFGTSGSTGKPKVVVCSHFQMINWTKQSAIRHEISDGTVYFCDRQFSWTVGFPRAFVTTGCTRVFVDTRMTLSGAHINQVSDIIEKERVNVVYMPGYLVKDFVSHPEYAPKFKDVKLIFVSGERFLVTALPLKDTFCQKLVAWYGSTECGGFATFHSDNAEEYEDGIIGIPCPGGEIKIVDEKDNVVPRGVAGQMCTRSPWRFNGYYGMPELFEKAVDSHGWFHPGDIARVRADGNIVVEGRTQERISMQTFKYFPWEVEKTLRKCPDTKFALAVGVPDPRLNQVVCACVVPKPGVTFTVEYLKKFCDDAFLEESTAGGLSLKPKYYLILPEIPLTSSGKIDRRRIGFIAKEKLGL